MQRIARSGVGLDALGRQAFGLGYRIDELALFAMRRITSTEFGDGGDGLKRFGAGPQGIFVAGDANRAGRQCASPDAERLLGHRAFVIERDSGTSKANTWKSPQVGAGAFA